MATPEDVTLWLHVLAGFVALIAGAVALLTTKGGRRHRLAGRGYVAAMAVVVGTVIPLFAFDRTALRAFLVLVAVFSGYFAFSGYRVLSRKRPADDPDRVDWVAAGLVVIACAALGGWGVVRVAGGDSFGVVLVVFGAIGLSMGLGDVRAFRAGERETPWIADHLSRMLGAYIATVSAVSAVNLTMLPPVVRWLWPTAVGVPLILYWQATYADTGPLAGALAD
jgi:uncharacterized membrane protein